MPAAASEKPARAPRPGRTAGRSRRCHTAGRSLANLPGDVHHHAAAADDLALHAQAFEQLDVFVSNLRQVLSQLLTATQVRQRNGQCIGHGQREFEIVAIGNHVGARGVYVNETDGAALAVDHVRAAAVSPSRFERRPN